ncbi:TetR/AcrR family transcriptional regulator [Promicromonospora sp. NPDC057488]|uniref:TetR/AcrR family transcriptional regulator n=1 Tax=Promicromonospora sp. NPDC057488 TaxID=3346147 RepID=UPI0036719D7A
MPDAIDERPYHHGNLRAALLEGAERSLRENGVDQLSLRDLTRAIGVSHAAPRRYFADRQALLDSLAEEGFTRLDTALRGALAAADEGFAARLRAIGTEYTRFATENPALLELMYSSKHRPGATRLAAAADAPFRLMYDVMAQGQEEGALEPGDHERVGIVLFATLQGVAALHNGNIVRPELLDGLVESAIEHFLRGARPRP